MNRRGEAGEKVIEPQRSLFTFSPFNTKKKLSFDFKEKQDVLSVEVKTASPFKYAHGDFADMFNEKKVSFSFASRNNNERFVLTAVAILTEQSRAHPECF